MFPILAPNLFGYLLYNASFAIQLGLKYQTFEFRTLLKSNSFKFRYWSGSVLQWSGPQHQNRPFKKGTSTIIQDGVPKSPNPTRPNHSPTEQLWTIQNPNMFGDRAHTVLIKKWFVDLQFNLLQVFCNARHTELSQQDSRARRDLPMQSMHCHIHDYKVKHFG